MCGRVTQIKKKEFVSKNSFFCGLYIGFVHQQAFSKAPSRVSVPPPVRKLEKKGYLLYSLLTFLLSSQQCSTCLRVIWFLPPVATNNLPIYYCTNLFSNVFLSLALFIYSKRYRGGVIIKMMTLSS